MNIYLIISLIFSTIVSYFTIKNFSKSKFSFKYLLIYFLLMFPLFLLINLYFNGVLKLMLVLLLTSISLYFAMFNKNLSDSLYYATVYEVFAFIVEIILSIIFVLVLNLNTDSYDSSSIFVLLFSLANSLILYLVSLIKPINRLVTKFNKILVRKQFEIIYVISIVVLMSIMLAYNGINLSNEYSFYINIGMVLFIFITLIYIIKRDFQNDTLENNYKEMMEYVQKYEKIINEQGKKNHEYNNQLMVIKGYAGNKKKLEEYLNLIVNEHKCGQNYTIRELSYFPDGGIKGLIYHKLSKMEDNNIKYYIYVDKNIKNIFEEKLDIKTYQDITKLLGVFLDNAIDATKDAIVKEIEIDIKKEEECIIITISNTFDNNLDIKQIGKKGFTTKGKGHGYGLSIVKDIAKHNDNIETFKDVEEQKFKQTILLYYTK